MVTKSYFQDKIRNNLKINDFETENVIGDDNSGFSALSQQIYNDQHNYNIVDSHIYNYLNNNKESYNTRFMIYNNDVITGDLYIPKIKNRRVLDGGYRDISSLYYL